MNIQARFPGYKTQLIQTKMLKIYIQKTAEQK